jgi:hypothetical protein
LTYLRNEDEISYFLINLNIYIKNDVKYVLDILRVLENMINRLTQIMDEIKQKEKDLLKNLLVDEKNNFDRLTTTFYQKLKDFSEKISDIPDLKTNQCAHSMRLECIEKYIELICCLNKNGNVLINMAKF